MYSYASMCIFFVFYTNPIELFVSDVYPNIWDGAKLLINKQLSSHFQISHNITMGQVSEGGYRFGATFIGPNQLGPAEVSLDRY